MMDLVDKPMLTETKAEDAATNYGYELVKDAHTLKDVQKEFKSAKIYSDDGINVWVSLGVGVKRRKLFVRFTYRKKAGVKGNSWDLEPSDFDKSKFDYAAIEFR